MSLHRVITDDEADLALLSLASDKRKFAIPVIQPMPDHMQFALERGMEQDWFRLIDVTAIAEGPPGRVFRIFRLTDAGMARLAVVAQQSGQSQ